MNHSINQSINTVWQKVLRRSHVNLLRYRNFCLHECYLNGHCAKAKVTTALNLDDYIWFSVWAPPLDVLWFIPIPTTHPHHPHLSLVTLHQVVGKKCRSKNQKQKKKQERAGKSSHKSVFSVQWRERSYMILLGVRNRFFGNWSGYFLCSAKIAPLPLHQQAKHTF